MLLSFNHALAGRSQYIEICHMEAILYFLLSAVNFSEESFLNHFR